MPAPPDRKRIISIMLLILATAALVWAVLRVYNMVQDHRAAHAASEEAAA